MAQSLSLIYLHLVFHIKRGSPAIREVDEGELYAYLSRVLYNMGCVALQVGGMSDHIHILFSLSKELSIAKVVQEVKIITNAFLKRKSNHYSNFAWQKGYGVFSVSLDRLQAVQHYIQHQKEHHQHHSSKEEYQNMLISTGISIEEQYLWD